ncbi:putative ribosomal small subunit assembly protein [Erysiphe necator]|uniref:Putative ribosomal small subunit assembly protein n=1 Tax=Uncinula necator TaxID=52586 RepID=A0A0B1P6D5_UNCNE|nr:putative ribosomal small subunit assembly protein [Erysiphe necator]
MSVSKFADYTVLNIIIPPIESFPEQCVHTMYIRRNQSKIPTENDSRSLFVVNVPIDSTSAHFRAIIGSLIGPGRFQSASFEDEKRTIDPIKDNNLYSTTENVGKKRKRTNDSEQSLLKQDLPNVWDRKLKRSGSSAVLLLVDEKSVSKVLNTAKKLQRQKKSMRNWPIWGDNLITTPLIPSLGSARYLSHHELQYPNSHQIQANIDAFMTEYYTRQKSQREHEKKSRSEPDADGFITVTRGGRTGPARKEIVEERSALLEERERKKREEMQKAGFYRFQGREKRKAEAEAMISKFKEDKKKIQDLRDKRSKSGFRPER